MTSRAGEDVGLAGAATERWRDGGEVTDGDGRGGGAFVVTSRGHEDVGVAGAATERWRDGGEVTDGDGRRGGAFVVTSRGREDVGVAGAAMELACGEGGEGGEVADRDGRDAGASVAAGAELDWHGIVRRYESSGRRASRLRELVPRGSWLDRDGVLAAWGERDDPMATVVRGVRRVIARIAAPLASAVPLSSAAPLASAAPREPNESHAPQDSRLRRDMHAPRDPDHPRDMHATRDPQVRWIDAFEAAVAAIARTARAPVVALGGGLDGAAILRAWQASGVPMPGIATIQTGIASYDEVDAAIAIAARFGCPCEVIAVSVDDLVDSIPQAAIAGEAPLYNLHPVTRLVMARELARRGAGTLVTGDGGDAVFAGVPDHDYVPIVAAYTRAYLVHASPYTSPAVIAASIATSSTPDRRVLRAYVGDDRPKRPRLMPAVDVARVVDRPRIERLADQLDLRPVADVRWATLDHLVRDLDRAVGSASGAGS